MTRLGLAGANGEPMKALPVLLAIALTLYVVELTYLAYDLCFTVAQYGGYIPAGMIVLSPVAFWAIGRYFPRFD